MSLQNAKVLFISQSITPFLPETDMSSTARHLPQGILENGNEIRVFMPKFGCINERRHQLHEVIRLSGMNLIIDDTDHALMIKVASLPSARMQVYFIDNEEYFKRKSTWVGKDGSFHADNDERALFFCRGVLETVRKLGWVPDIIHCHGWMPSFIPMYIKTLFADDPHFENAKLVYSVYDDKKEALDKDLATKLSNEGFNGSIVSGLQKPSTNDLYKVAIDHSDAVVCGSPKLNKSLKDIVTASKKPVMEYAGRDEQLKASAEFYASIMEEALV